VFAAVQCASAIRVRRDASHEQGMGARPARRKAADARWVAGSQRWWGPSPQLRRTPKPDSLALQDGQRVLRSLADPAALNVGIDAGHCRPNDREIVRAGRHGVRRNADGRGMKFPVSVDAPGSGWSVPSNHEAGAASETEER
jgi:hypothetical protein